MRRHFSSRGEALAEVAAAKMTTHRMPLAKSVFPSRRRKGVTPGQWQAQVPEGIGSTSPSKKREPIIHNYSKNL